MDPCHCRPALTCLGDANSYTDHENLAININGDQGSFFQTFRGVRRAVTLFPLSCLIVTPVMINFANYAGHIIDLVPHLIQQGLNLAYLKEMKGSSMMPSFVLCQN
jgi:hypothetical protein